MIKKLFFTLTLLASCSNDDDNSEKVNEPKAWEKDGWNLVWHDEFDGDELDIKLQGIIAKLPPKQKLVFQMKYYDDLKFKEISQILGTSVGALKTSYHLAKNKIKKEISENQTF